MKRRRRPRPIPPSEPTTVLLQILAEVPIDGEAPALVCVPARVYGRRLTTLEVAANLRRYPLGPDRIYRPSSTFPPSTEDDPDRKPRQPQQHGEN